MSSFNPCVTADGSVGLYSNEFNDIYHSVKGALTESLEKFIMPVNYEILLQHDEIKILDICYGIGYNTKTFLNYLYNNQNKFLKLKSKLISNHERYYDTIHTDKILDNKTETNIDTVYTDKNKFIHSKNKLNECNSSIYSDKIFNKISIHAIDNDKILTLLSPLIVSKTNYIKSKNLPEEYFGKYLKDFKKSKFKTNDIINYILLRDLYNEELSNDNIINISEIACNNKKIISSKLYAILSEFYNSGGYNTHFKTINSNLHNIYYRYISSRYKKAANNLKIGNISFKVYNDDARQVVINDKNEYNLIFLDAFSPSKCPCLWSYEFFCELFRLLSDDGMLLTYSTSASVRNAMLESGFYIGNTMSSDKSSVIGTVAVKNKTLIKYPLSESDLGLLKTRAGIFYRDKNLSGQYEAIIEERNAEVKSSTKISATQYLKNSDKEAKCMM